MKFQKVVGKVGNLKGWKLESEVEELEKVEGFEKL